LRRACRLARVEHWGAQAPVLGVYALELRAQIGVALADPGVLAPRALKRRLQEDDAARWRDLPVARPFVAGHHARSRVPTLCLDPGFQHDTSFAATRQVRHPGTAPAGLRKITDRPIAVAFPSLDGVATDSRHRSVSYLFDREIFRP
jgi:hypothetical protein